MIRGLQHVAFEVGGVGVQHLWRRQGKILTRVFHCLKEDYREDVARCLRGGGKDRMQVAECTSYKKRNFNGT